MAILEINIPDDKIDRLIIALKPLMKEGEADDLENPTGQEAKLKAEDICKKYLIAVWKEQEWIMNNDSFEFEDTGIE